MPSMMTLRFHTHDELDRVVMHSYIVSICRQMSSCTRQKQCRSSGALGGDPRWLDMGCADEVLVRVSQRVRQLIAINRR